MYLRAREYDPATGQFTTVDPDVDTTRQPYAYVANDPLALTDVSGLDWWGDTQYVLHDQGGKLPGELGQGGINIGSIFVGIGASVVDISTPCLIHDAVGLASHSFSDCYQDLANSLSGGAACNIEDNGFFTFGTLWGGAALGAVGGGALSAAKLSEKLPQINRAVQLAGGGRGGQLVKSMTGPANSIVRGASPGRIYQTNRYGQVIADFTRARVKPVLPGVGFVRGTGRKLVPTSEQLR